MEADGKLRFFLESWQRPVQLLALHQNQQGLHEHRRRSLLPKKRAAGKPVALLGLLDDWQLGIYHPLVTLPASLERSWQHRQR